MEIMEIQELYIEPTSRCNLACTMCSRNHWANETIGDLDYALFEKAIDEIPNTVNRVFFGGVGEPLMHPQIFSMIRKVKEKGLPCELITNGTLLDEKMCRTLLDLQVDKLWVSLDWVDANSEGNLGHKAGTLHNLFGLKALRDTPQYELSSTKLCIMFVLTKRNREHLDKLMAQTEYLGINEIKVTHLLPYDISMEEDICYGTLYPFFGRGGVRVDLPFIDTRTLSSKTLQDLALQGRQGNMSLNIPARHEYCRFVQEGVVFLRWDGEISPCMPLLHDNTVYQAGQQRQLLFCTFGNIRENTLEQIWEEPSYSQFRQRVSDFNFSPCATCGACDLFSTNEEDCIGSPFPACGHCLWAYGLIQCP